ncbi:PilN domain-containing protein [Alteromonas oceanisediminis]|uniref:PilN domain-containing protein n=1 Tax=Alteromonas oceanisediminis TaxID=2836180 RepID=UPI001BD97334|nr:PilN domain-containing protein [Alteromonas oceanisediminis]MBT0586092.1 PilN domain-containing protein [Alteromonas oceanisediminis]
MAHINLLPWRENLRQRQKQQYLGVLFITAVFVGLIFWFVGAAIDQQIRNQQARNNYLQDQINVLDAQISQIKTIKDAKAAIEQRMALIEQLQTSRNVAPKVFDELARIVPPGVAFRSMTRTGNRIDIDGISDSNNRLSDFMRRLETSTVFTNGVLSSIVADTTSTDAVSEFKLTFTISPEVAPVMVSTTQGNAQ